MDEFFNNLYGITCFFYGRNLDDYLIDETPGYLHYGLLALIVSFVVSAVYYYLYKPVQRQTWWWFVFFAIDGGINFLVAMYLANSAMVPEEASWSVLDSFFFSLTDVIWSFVFYVVAALILKWWSICKYVPFKYF